MKRSMKVRLAAVLLGGYQNDQFWLEAPLAERVLWLGGLICSAGVAYGLTLFILGFRPRDFRKT